MGFEFFLVIKSFSTNVTSIKEIFVFVVARQSFVFERHNRVGIQLGEAQHNTHLSQHLRETSNKPPERAICVSTVRPCIYLKERKIID